MKIGEKERIVITRTDSHFDRACEAAYDRACGIVGLDRDGHMMRVEKSERSIDALMVKFVTLEISGGMGGVDYTYVFECWVTRVDDDIAGHNNG